MSAPSFVDVSRPTQVSLALALFAVGLFLAPVRVAFRVSWDRPGIAAFTVLFFLGIASLWTYGLHRRKRWLWWFTVISLAIGVVGIPWDIARQGTGFQLTLYYVQCAACVPAVVLLCMAPARRWFRVSAA